MDNNSKDNNSEFMLRFKGVIVKLKGPARLVALAIIVIAAVAFAKFW